MTSTSNKVCCPDGQESLIAVHEIHTQKSILNQNRVHQSLYLQNIASLNNTINNTNEGIKYDSYQRYLLKKKGQLYSKQGSVVASTPSYGNKTKSFSLTSKTNKGCNFCT
jgi:hypothetical protein